MCSNSPTSNACTGPTKPVVLLVEDDLIVAESVEECLRDMGGFIVYRAASARTAREYVQKYPTLRFVVLDVGLPDEDFPNDPDSTGFRLIREFAKTLPKARIYLKMQRVMLQSQHTYVQSFGTVVEISAFFDPMRVLRHAQMIYENDQVRPRIVIVHGHHSFLLQELISFIQNDIKIGDPVVLKDRPNFGNTIIEKFEHYAGDADLVFALLTPDDETDNGRMARQNVIFEIGYFVGALGRKSRKIILLHVNGTEKPSDLDGLVTVDVSRGIANSKLAILQQLEGWWGMSAS